jgi:hypothetical protein
LSIIVPILPLFFGIWAINTSNTMSGSGTTAPWQFNPKI